MTYTISIEPKKGSKGRTFSAYLFNTITADSAWESGSGDLTRPVYLAFTTSEREAHAFTANLRSGRRAVVRNAYGHEEAKIEILKSSGHRFVTERCRRSGSALVTVYLPSLFELDPGLLDPHIRFVFAPASWWIERELASPALESFPPEEAREFVVAAAFAAFLDRRTSLPIINDPRFHRQLYRAAKEERWWHEPASQTYGHAILRVFPQEIVGLEQVALVNLDHDTFESFLRRQTSIFYRTVESVSRALPRIAPPPARSLQLSLFDLPGAAA